MNSTDVPSSDKSSEPRFAVRLRENLFLGLISLTPLAITLWILSSIIGSLDSFFLNLLPASISPKEMIGIHIPGLGIVFTFVLLFIAGTAARTFLGRLFEEVSESFFKRIPFVGGLYKTARQVSHAFFSKDSAKAFKKVVYVPFPSAPAKAIAFVTAQAGNGHTTVFVPTSPNPTGGYILNYPDHLIEDAHMTVEAALKFILSGGAVSTLSAESPSHETK